MSNRTSLNRLLGRFGVLRKTDLRYKAIQLMGYLLYGRKIGYLSWWQHAALSGNLILIHKGKILIARRRNMLDANGKFSGIGGFIEMERGETVEEGILREVLEETGMDLDISKLDRGTLFRMRCWTGSIAEMDDMYQLGVSYVYHLSNDELRTLTETEEMHEFRFVDKAEMDRLHAEGAFAFEGEYRKFRQAFDEGVVTP